MDSTRLARNNQVVSEPVRRVESTPGLGLEPRLSGPEPLVLPLHHPGISQWRILTELFWRKLLYNIINLLGIKRRDQY